MPKGETSKNFAVVLYDDSDTHSFDIVFERVRDVAVKWCYILHDLDDAKPHYHVLFRTQHQRSVSAVLRDLGLSHGIKMLNSYDAYKTYMRHADQKSIDAGKHLYPEQSLVFSDTDDNSYLKKSKEEIELERALGFYDEIVVNGLRSTKQLFQYAIKSNSWGFFRQNYTILKDLALEMGERRSNARRYSIFIWPVYAYYA